MSQVQLQQFKLSEEEERSGPLRAFHVALSLFFYWVALSIDYQAGTPESSQVTVHGLGLLLPSRLPDI